RAPRPRVRGCARTPALLPQALLVVGAVAVRCPLGLRIRCGDVPLPRGFRLGGPFVGRGGLAFLVVFRLRLALGFTELSDDGAAHRTQLFDGDRARTQHTRNRVGQIHDRGGCGSVALTPVEIDGHLVTELLDGFLHPVGRGPSRLVGTADRHRTGLLEQLQGPRLHRHAYRHRAFGVTQVPRQARGGRAHQGERAGPELLHEVPAVVSQVVDERRGGPHRPDQDRWRHVPASVLGLQQPCHSGRAEGVCADAVHGVRGKHDEVAPAHRRRSVGDAVLAGGLVRTVVDAAHLLLTSFSNGSTDRAGRSDGGGIRAPYVLLGLVGTAHDHKTVPTGHVLAVEHVTPPPLLREEPRNVDALAVVVFDRHGPARTHQPAADRFQLTDHVQAVLTRPQGGRGVVVTYFGGDVFDLTGRDIRGVADEQV